MMVAINIHEAKINFSRLVDRAHQGEIIILAKEGKPYARLMPLEVARHPGGLDGELGDAFFAALPDEELAAWETQSDPANSASHMAPTANLLA